MTIGSGDSQEKIGTSFQLLTSSAIADGAMSFDTETFTWTNDVNAPEAKILFICTPISAVNVNSGVSIFSQLIDAGGPSFTEPEPTINSFEHTFMGHLAISPDLIVAQYNVKRIKLRNSVDDQQYRFRFKNNTGVTLSFCTAFIQPITNGPIP